MPNDEKLQRAEERVKFLADRMAMLLVELVRRDMDYGRFCHEEFYTDEGAGYLRQGREYEVSIDFVRNMVRRFDNEQATGRG